MENEILQIRALARLLQSQEPKTDAKISLIGFMVGALFALDLAASLGYHDERSRPDPSAFATEFGEALAAVAAGTAVQAPWQAGFYYNSALMRLAALNERIDKTAGDERDDGAAIRRSVNSLKHHVDAHISGQRPIAFADAVRLAKVLCDRLTILS